MEERRAARVGTVSGLALLTGATALAAVAGGGHSVAATCGLGVLSVGLAHALLDEVRRQAGRRSPDGWATPDTVNALFLAAWAVGGLVTAALLDAPVRVRVLAGALAVGYAAICTGFVVLRRRGVAQTATAGRRDDAASGLAYGSPPR